MNNSNEIKTNIKIKKREVVKTRREIVKIKKEIEELKVQMINNKVSEIMCLSNNMPLVKRYNLSVKLQEKDNLDKTIIIKDAPIYNDYKPTFSIVIKITEDYVFITAETSSLRYWETRPLNHNILYSISISNEILVNKITKLLRKGIAHRIQRLNHPLYKENHQITLYK